MRWIVVTLGVIVALASARLYAQTAVADPPAESKPATADAATDDTAASPESAAKDADADEEQLYIQFAKTDDGKPKSLQTAIVRFEGNADSPYADRVVDLVGVVHIGQKEYYKDLNTRLSKYDSVLYELVAPDGTRIRPEDLKERRSVLASMQTGMKDMLNLEYQLELIDYMAKNFRHADMSPDEFVEDLERRGDSVWKMVARMMGAGLASQASGGGDAGMLFAMFSSDRPKKMKQAMARQLVDIELVTAGMDDANGENTLIKGRNGKAFDVLRDDLDNGKQSVAVFYGAGHLPDMAERLETDFQMHPVETTWLDAWDLTRN
ncbi:hypothetical protein K227x_29390 [Rubripirellula lacrimiformis]|uniref:TraB family protein n=1 Tax=Rubripirellula lacrimiformis TaxID=1930273 RepID=A0A517NBN5_9BACT|nr:TraB/GumN family protein [Rubripirellula lacrimiformis]QDT04547.1 hypothetical protein K227x_29390 [Rubripirellula lacrimiformis]